MVPLLFYSFAIWRSFFYLLFCLMSFFGVIKIIIGIYYCRRPFRVFVRSPNRFMFTLISNALGLFPGLLPIINFKVSTLLFDIFYFVFSRDCLLTYKLINIVCICQLFKTRWFIKLFKLLSQKIYFWKLNNNTTLRPNLHDVNV